MRSCDVLKMLSRNISTLWAMLALLSSAQQMSAHEPHLQHATSTAFAGRSAGVGGCDAIVDGSVAFDDTSDVATRTFSTIAAAQEYVQSLYRKSVSDAALICIRGGIYAESLRFDASDSNSLYVAVPGEGVVVSGAVPITFTPASFSDPVWSFVAPNVASQLAAPTIWVADLVAAGITNVSLANEWIPRGFDNGMCGMAPMELIYEDRVQTVARWPNVDDGSHGTTPGFTMTEWHDVSQGLSNNSLWANPATAPYLAYADTANMWIHSFPKYEWSDSYNLYGGVASGPDPDGNVQVMFGPQSPARNFSVVGSARYYVVNSLDALDAPGEYYVNSSSGLLYFIPPLGATDLNAGSVTINTTLLTLQPSTSNLAFVGIQFDGVRGHAAELQYTTNVSFINCTFTNIGMDAINVGGSNSTLVSGVAISDTGCAGVRFNGGGDRLSLTASGNVVVDSTITRFERLCFTYNGGITLDTGGVAAHNDVFDGPHNGITLDGNDVLIIGNTIHNTTRWTFDNGAIYWYPCDWTKQNTTIMYNFLYWNAQDPSTCNSYTSCGRHAIYPDNGNAGVNIISNVVWHPDPGSHGANIECLHCQPIERYVNYGIFNDGGRDMTAANNLFVLDNANFSFNGAAGLTWDFAQDGNSSTYYADLRAVQWNTTGSLYSSRYPILAQLQDYWPMGGIPACAADVFCGAAPYGNAMTTNVIYNASGVMTYPPPSAGIPDAAFNISNNLVNIDPHFVDPEPRASLNFQLRDDSPAYALGFQRIPMECFGVGKRCPGERNWGRDAMESIVARIQSVDDSRHVQQQ